MRVSSFASLSSSCEQKYKKEGSFGCNNEPISVLDTRRSPSPSTSTSTLSSSLGNGSTENKASLVPVCLPPETSLGDLGGELDVNALGLEDWESLLSESAGQDQNLLRWISGDVEDTCFTLKQLLQGAGNLNEIDGNVNTNLNSCLGNAKSGLVSVPNPCGLNNNNTSPSPNFSSVCPGVVYQRQNQYANADQKAQVFNTQMMLNQSQVNITQQEQHQFEPQPKRHNPGIQNSTRQIPKVPLPQQTHFPTPHLMQHKPLVVPMQEVTGSGSTQQMVAPNHYHHQKQAVYDHLYKATEVILAGNFSHAQMILARLNHHLAPMEKPFQRAAFYFKEALQMPLLVPNYAASVPSKVPTPFDGMFKIGAYRVLSEVSPLIQFMNFTSNQALLEALSDADNIHIIDFDIGFGAQWASFMQELPRGTNGVAPSLKITAFASPTTHHPLELGLMHENLSSFAHEIGVSFKLEVVNIDSFDPKSHSVPHFRSTEDEAIAVNLPIGSSSGPLFALPSLLRFINQLSPRIMVSMERGCERTELPFSQHVLHALHYYELLLESIDAANVTSDTANKIERFLFQHKIESTVLGRLRAPEPMPHWKTLFASAGFSPVALSSFTEAQAECLVKRTQVRGFHVEKSEASLVLSWQHRELVSVSAWKC